MTETISEHHAQRKEEHEERKHEHREKEVAQKIDSLHQQSDEELLKTGLVDEQVKKREDLGLTNAVPRDSSRSIWQILRANLFTLFNAVLGVCLLVVLLIGDWQDGLFGFIVLANILIGVVQEYRAKKTLDKLAVLNAPQATVVRDKKEEELALGKVVYDDLVVLRAGAQVPADGRVLQSFGLSIDESLLTGESDPIAKSIDDEVLAGSAVVSGYGYFRVNRIGTETFASQLTSEAKRFSLVNSEIRNSINKIIRYITYALIPLVGLILNGQMRANGGWAVAIESGRWREAVISSVASIVGMVPEGLVLITSISLGLAAVTLARRNVLVQELPAVEGLARVNIFCVDKTGTLTEGSIVFDRAQQAEDPHVADIVGTKWENILAVFGADTNANATASTLKTRYTDLPDHEPDAAIAFSSARKWSAVSYNESSYKGTWVLGAPEIVLKNSTASNVNKVLETAGIESDKGLRVLALTYSPEPLTQVQEENEELVDHIYPVAILTFSEKLREDAPGTMNYFRGQDVDLRVISGDNPKTVAAVAAGVGIGVGKPGYDARELPDDIDELADVLEEYEVFGRVTPEQKKNIVLALQKKDHVVAMTGDGVNDALALKSADIGVAMGSGADATKAVGRLVLLDDKFSHMPGVVAEGRRVIANIERVANLFLSKTVYSISIALFIALAALVGPWLGSTTEFVYPFLPRQLSIVSSLTIGIPSFLLALLPNKRRYIPGFLKRVLIFSIPAGLIVSVAVVVTYSIAQKYGLISTQPKIPTGVPYSDLSQGQLNLMMGQTSVLITLVLAAFWILCVLCRPLDKWRIAVLSISVIGLIGVLAIPIIRDFFLLNIPHGQYQGLLWWSLGMGLAGCVGIEILYQYLQHRNHIAVKSQLHDK